MLVLLPGVSLAGSFQIVPFVGARFGGEFESSYDDFFFDDFDLEVEDGESFGVSVNVPLGRNLYLELLASRQDTELTEGGFFLDEIPLFDLEVDYYHIGIGYRWMPGQVQPYVVGTVGTTRFRPTESGFDDESRLSVAVGGGVQLMFTDNVGLRLDGRLYTTTIDDDDEVFCDRFDRCYRYENTDYLWQVEATAGLVFSF
ncbi:MAG: outer membrane beta-barrel protein [Acidobacteriota bacterium]